MSTAQTTETVTQRNRDADRARGPIVSTAQTTKTVTQRNRDADRDRVRERKVCRTTGRASSPRHSSMGDLGSTATTGPVLKALYRIADAMVLLSVSKTVIYEEMRAGRLRYVLQGSARRITAAAITDYVKLLEDESRARTA